MTTNDHAGDRIEISIGGSVPGQIAVGDWNQLNQSTVAAPKVTDKELAELRRLVGELKARIMTEAPPDEQSAALQQADQLEEAVVTERPDLSTMESIRTWFTKHLPAVAGSVTGLVVHPIVGKLVEAAGEAAAGEFRRRFGGAARG